MKEYKDIKCDTFDAFNVPNVPKVSNVTTISEEQENGLNWQKIHQLERRMERKLVGNARIFKTTSKNAVKQLRVR